MKQALARLGLLFPTASEEQDFVSNYVLAALPRTRAAMIIGCFVYFFFFLWDRIIDPTIWQHTLLIRAAVVALILIPLTLLTSWPAAKRHIELILLSYCAVPTAALAIIYGRLDNGFVHGAAGMIIIILFVASLLPLRSTYFAVFASITWACFAIQEWAASKEGLGAIIAVNHFYLGTALMLALYAVGTREIQARREFRISAELLRAQATASSALISFREANESLRQANRRLLDQWERARRARSFQNEMLGTVAHDLKSPIGAILGRIDIVARLVSRVPLDLNRCRTQTQHMRDAATHMSGMLDRLVADAMEDALDVSIRREQGLLGELVRQVVEANRSRADAKRQQINFDGASANLPSTFDADRMRDALDNLIGNAVKYSPFDAEIRVAMAANEKEDVVRVIDHGPGLQSEDFDRLFGRFQRLSAKPTAGESSTGLGLFSAKRIVDLHGGMLSADSPGPGQGSTFEIRLPRTLS